MQRKTLFLAYFFICVNCFAQQYPFVYYTPKDGLINSRVRSIKQDSRGRMLFTTYGGLSIYDGTRFINYNQDNGLANDLVNDIIEITPDSFLVATNTRKLNTLVHGRIGIYQTADHFYPVVNRFFKSNDGNWYAAADEGLFEFKNKRFIHLDLNKNGKDLGTCLDKIIEWKNYFLIIPWNPGLAQKMILYNRATNTVEDVVTTKTVSSAVVDSKNEIWVNTSDGIQQIGLTALQKGKMSFTPAPLPYRSVKKSDLFFDAAGNAWFYGGNEIQKITPGFQMQFFSTDQGLKVGALTHIFQDKEGIMWMATDGNGIIKLKSAAIQLLNSLQGKPMLTYAICQAKDTTWLFNEPDNCIYRITEKESKKIHLWKKLGMTGIYNYLDKLYLVTTEGIFLIHHKNKPSSFLQPQIFFADSSIAFGAAVVDRYGTVISVTNKNGIHHLSIIRQNKVLTQYNLSTLADQLSFDQQGRLWVASRDDQIMVFTVNPSDDVHYLQLAERFSGGLPVMGIRCLTVDKENSLWIGTRNNGLYHFQVTEHQLRLNDHYTTKNGLTDNFIYTLACDSNNVVWIGTQTGLDKIFKRGQNYIIANVGKNNNNFQIVTRIEIAGNGTVWSVNNDGTILKVSAAPSSFNHTAPVLFLTSLKVDNEEWNQTANSFSYKQNNLSFTAAAPSFLDEKSIRYACSLEGSDNAQWSEPSNLASFSFFNLRPGRYHLHVRCEFPEAIYPSREITYSFVIHKPWWQTWWFITSIGLLVLGILLLFIRSYYHRKLERQKLILEKKQAVEKERTRIATDMHDDLGAGLSRIKFLSETIGIKKQQHQPIEEDVIKIREYSHQMIDRMGEIVWALNEKNDSLNDLIAYTRAYAVEYLSQNGINCAIELPHEPKNHFVSGEFRRNIFLSVKEVLHNIVKHARANKVAITIGSGKELTIEIKDDGKGIDLSNIRPFSNGLSNIKNRMKEIGGSSEIINHAGTCIILSAPL